MTRPSTIVISDWLANCRTEQWTPFEAATALKAVLMKEGYVVALKEDVIDLAARHEGEVK
jgi:hypothetical protein